jgi:serralysin
VSPNSSWNVAGVGDFTGNGIDDILWQNSNSALAIWIMDGSAIISGGSPTYQGAAVSPDPSWSVAGIGDFNGNGNDDILWRQRSTGALAEWQMNGATITSSAALTFQGTAVTPDSSWSLAAIGDFTGSNRPTFSGGKARPTLWRCG